MKFGEWCDLQVSATWDNRVLGPEENEFLNDIKPYLFNNVAVGNIGCKFISALLEYSDSDYTEEILNNENSLMKLRSDEFSVYEEGIKAGADCVMVGSMSVSKITVKEIPAFLSTDIVTSILREELGFEGVVMTPPLNEGVITKNYTSEYVAVEAVKAGCDMIVMPENLEESYEALLSEVRSGRLDEKVINTAVCRILQNKIERGILVLENSDE